MSRARALLAALALSLVSRGRGRPRLRPGERERIVQPSPKSPGSELLATCLFLAAAVCAIAFVVVYVLDRLPRPTQLLGLSLALALAFLAAGLIVTGKRGQMPTR